MGLKITYQEGETALSDDEKNGLLIPSVSTRQELDEVEQQNIDLAFRWTVERRRKFTVEEILSEHFIRDLHVRMYGNVWGWAGQFRKTDKNIGVEFYQISTALRGLLDDCKYWLNNQSFGADETAVRFKHRLVSIHCFPNGNGRHSRLMGDLIVDKIFGRPFFSWGSHNLIANSNFRKTYIASLQAADRGDYTALICFARS